MNAKVLTSHVTFLREINETKAEEGHLDIDNLKLKLAR